MSKKLRENYNSWYKENIANKNGELPARTKRFYSEILDNLVSKSRKKNPKILDVACGTGKFLMEAKAKGLDLYGVDISDTAVKIARKETKGTIRRCSAEKLPFKNNSFEYLTCIGSLEHFENPEKAVNEFARVIKPGGIVMIHVPNLMFAGHIYMTMRYGIMPSEGEQDFSENYLTNQGWKDLINTNGLKIIDTDAYNDIFVSNRVGPLARLGWQLVGQHVVPFNLSYAFNYYCKKSNAKSQK